MLPWPSRVLVTNPDRQLPCHFSKTVLRIPSTRTHPAKSHRQQRYVQQGVPHRERSVSHCWGHDEPVPPATRQTPVAPPRCSSRQGSPGRMPVPDVQWLHRDMGKDSWIFSSYSNAHSSDRPTAAKAGGKIRIPFHIRRKGAEVFCPALAFGGFIDGLQVPVVMRSFQLLRCFQKESAPCRLPTHSGSGLAAAWHSGELSAFLGQTGSSGYF